MSGSWPSGTVGIVTLPSGRTVRGRGLRAPLPGGAEPEFSVWLTGARPADVAWAAEWIRWRDFWLPTDPPLAEKMLRDAHERAAELRVEFACGGGIGRTGTALAALAVFEGMSPVEAVRWVRRHYHRRAVETPWQRRFVGGLI